jgi:ABC-type branched-subunit amino acid transport system permease subunit
MKTNYSSSLKTGTIFGIVTIFLFLIGFTGTAADLIGKVINVSFLTTGMGLTSAMSDLMIFLGLMGILAGANGGRKVEGEPDAWSSVIIRAAASGFIQALMVAVLVFLVGNLNTAGVKMSTYLPQVLPDAIRQLLLGQAPLPASLIHLVFMTLMGLLGGVIVRGVGRGSWRVAFSDRWDGYRSRLDRHPLIQKVNANPSSRYIIYAVIAVFILLLPLVLGQYWNYTVGTIGIYVLLGLGLNIVVGLAGLLDLGYVAFFAIGAYTTALLTAPEPHHLLINFWITIPLGILLAAVAGVLLGIPVLRMRGDYLAIVTLGFGQIIGILLKSDILTPFTGGPKGVSAVGGPVLFGKPFASDIDFVYLILLAVMLIIFVTNRLQNSRIGRAWEAMREDESVARAMGINILTTKLLAFAIGAAFAGLGGVLFAARNQFTGPEDHNLMVSINVLALVIVGGMGSIPGVIAGAFVLKGLPEILRELENYRVLAFGALLVAMMIIRPAGLIPSSRRKLDVPSKKDSPPEPPGGKAGRNSI